MFIKVTWLKLLRAHRTSASHALKTSETVPSWDENEKVFGDGAERVLSEHARPLIVAWQTLWMTRSVADDDRNRWQPQSCDTGKSSEVRYAGASHGGRQVILSGTRNQWRLEQWCDMVITPAGEGQSCSSIWHDWSLPSSWFGRAANVEDPLSCCDRTRYATSDRRTAGLTDRRILLIWRRAPKQPAAVFVTWVCMVGSWCCRWADVHHMTSVCAVFSWRQTLSSLQQLCCSQQRDTADCLWHRDDRTHISVSSANRCDRSLSN